MALPSKYILYTSINSAVSGLSWLPCAIDPRLASWICCVQGVVHITGGGFPENIPRIVPKGKDLGFQIQRSAWSVPPLFQWLQQV